MQAAVAEPAPLIGQVPRPGNQIGYDTSGKSLTYRQAGDNSDFLGATFDSRLNNWSAPSINQECYVRNYHGYLCEQQ